MGRRAARGQIELLDEDALLDVARGVVVVIVEADFAPGEELGACGETLELVVVGLGGKLGFMRVDAGGHVDPIVSGGEGDWGVQGVDVAADGQDGRDAHLAGTLEHFGAVGVECSVVQVGVRVNQGQRLYRCGRGVHSEISSSDLRA